MNKVMGNDRDGNNYGKLRGCKSFREEYPESVIVQEISREIVSLLEKDKNRKRDLEKTKAIVKDSNTVQPVAQKGS